MVGETPAEWQLLEKPARAAVDERTPDGRGASPRRPAHPTARGTPKVSKGTESWEEAKRELKKREGKAATGQPILPRVDRIRYEELAADLRAHYETSGSRDLDEADGRFAHLRAFLTGQRAARIGQADATVYVARRQGEGA